MAFPPKKGLKTRATMVFEDEAGFSERPTVRRTWALRGHTPIIRSSGSWKKRTATGALVCTPRGGHPRLMVRISAGAMRAPDALRFLAGLRRHCRGRVMVFWDGLPAHRAKIVRAFITTQRAWLEVHRFPAYAPECNPQEYIWSVLKGKDTANYCPKDIADLDRRIRSGKRRLQRHADILTGCLQRSGLFPRRKC